MRLINIGRKVCQIRTKATTARENQRRTGGHERDFGQQPVN